MTASLHWIDEARDFYQARPWVALALKVPISERVDTLFDAVRAIVRHRGADSLRLVISTASTVLIEELLPLVGCELVRRGIMSPELLDHTLEAIESEHVSP